MGMMLCCGAFGAWTLDESRHSRESLHPAVYYASSYYELWTRGLEILLQRHGFVTQNDLAAGKAVEATRAPKRVLKAADVASAMARGGPCNRPLLSQQ